MNSNLKELKNKINGINEIENKIKKKDGLKEILLILKKIILSDFLYSQVQEEDGDHE